MAWITAVGKTGTCVPVCGWVDHPKLHFPQT